ncbi:MULTISPECIES: TonB-dependent siderophore receptor [unclassified Lentimonas]|uniref:TonB-dependent siderophore receptor n=1 Tax=unclassified Lentimonas TaxID=2630993 RepID=UPI0013205F63|nr:MULTISPECIES: TonB-dependent receptor [unclassified Lentimonas]CAA6696511.1 Unannotated [Lentimonas sp. CC19]CAA6696679.1 Unannotated [Lentimonas sp. CC10]CAA7072440.1 Unannotated [Lentimonas sp. CC11]
MLNKYPQLQYARLLKIALPIFAGLSFLHAEEPVPLFQLPDAEPEEASPAVDAATDAAPGEAESLFVLPDEEDEAKDGEPEYGQSEMSEEDADDRLGAGEEATFVLPDFVVSSEKDEGYYSANSLGGTRTNQLIKNTPMTIDVVNRDLMDDLGMNMIDDLAGVLAGVDAEVDTGFNNRSLIFRGLKTNSQLFEFMPRQIAQDGYNIERAEIIRGANSLIYGQAAPGGRANFLAKQAEFGKTEHTISGTAGNNEYYRGEMDSNLVVNEKLAVRVMAVHDEREFDQKYKSQTFDGQTVDLTYRATEKTQARLHLENVDSFRNGVNAMYEDNTGRFGATGQYENYNEMQLPVTHEIVQFLPGAIKDKMIDFNEINPNTGDSEILQSDGSRLPSDSFIPDVYENEQDIKDVYKTMGSSNDKIGQYVGPDNYREIKGQYILGDITHSFADNLKLKVAAAQELSNTTSRTRSGTNAIKLANNSLASSALDNNNRVVEYFAGDPNDPSVDVLSGASVVTGQTKSDNDDDTTSIRSTLTWSTEIAETQHQFLFGYDFDYRNTQKRSEKLYQEGSYADADGTIVGNAWSKRYTIATGEGYTLVGKARDNIWVSSSSGPEGWGNTSDGVWLDNSESDADITTNAVWLADQGTYFDGRLHTLFGIRFDDIDVNSQSSNIQNDGYNSGEKTSAGWSEWSPSIGVLYWLTEDVAVFANYSESIESPTGYDRDAYGNIVPPQMGKGYEGGFKFSKLDGKLNGQIIAFWTQKENDSSPLTKTELQRIYPIQSNPSLYDNNGNWDGQGNDEPGTTVEVQGIEASLYYNPTRALSLVLSYAYLETEKTKSPLEEQKGDTVEGTAPHSVSFSARYSFRDGRIKGTYVGMTHVYRSKSLYDTYHNITDADGTEDWNRDIWLSDHHETAMFVGWRGYLGGDKDAPQLAVQFTVKNIFDQEDLIAVGNSNAKFTAPRSYFVKASVTF